jgi:putative SOS response-associated peptidase YedK
MFTARTITVLAKNREGKIADIDMRWGLIPASYTGHVEAWTASTMNARLETVAELPSFQHAWSKKRRVIIPMENYVQKVTTGANVFGGKPAAKKVAITRADGKPLGVAGIYDHAQTMDGPILSVASLTREPGPRMAKVHDREPVVIDLENWRAWLDGADNLGLEAPWADDAFDLKPSK